MLSKFVHNIFAVALIFVCLFKIVTIKTKIFVALNKEIVFSLHVKHRNAVF